MINKETILSNYDKKLTLLQWLKYTNKALENDTLTGVEVRQKGNATFSFVLTFEDGTEVESNEFVLAQGESINGATIRNGHLYLSLTNGDELDAGNLKPVTSFAINANQHLIVNYGDGTTQDLGAIFSGNVNINGTLKANVVDGTKVTGNEIVEKMSGYSFNKTASTSDFELSYNYASACKTGNKITFAIFGSLKRLSESLLSNVRLGIFNIPSTIGEKLYPIQLSGINTLGTILTNFANGITTKNEHSLSAFKMSNTQIGVFLYDFSTFEVGTNYTFRFEMTFLLNGNMAG